MPCYLMRCPCGHEEEVYGQSYCTAQVLDDYGKPCPVCGCKMRRVPARTAVMFKGDGWTKPNTTKESE